MDVLIKILQVIIAFSVLIILHEFGHYLFARLFGIRVDKFYLFFDLGGKSLLKFRKGDTEYGIGWLPLGGYCKIAGMVDESMDMESLRKEPQSWEFRTHPAWQRLLVMAGGVLFNFIFAILVYIAIMAIWGQSYISNENTRVWVDETAYEMGFRNGDRILAMDDYVPEDFAMLQADLARRDVHVVKVLRGADTVDLYLDRSLISKLLGDSQMFDIALPFVVAQVQPEGVNPDCGLQAGDRITAFDGQSVSFVQDAREVLLAKAGGTTLATVLRGADSFPLEMQVDTLGRIGVILESPDVRHRSYNVLQAIPAGVKYTFTTIGGYLQDLRLMVTPSSGAYKYVGSFIAIGQVFPSTWDWYRFMSILALLSIMLAVMNLLPIPGLDGGHILFVLYEMVTGRKPSERFLGIAQMIGMVILLGLMVLAFGNDIGRLIH